MLPECLSINSLQSEYSTVKVLIVETLNTIRDVKFVMRLFEQWHRSIVGSRGTAAVTPSGPGSASTWDNSCVSFSAQERR